MKTFIITVEIEHTDKSFNSTEIQEFINGISLPQAEWVKVMKKAFKETTLGHNAFGIEVTYAIKEWKYWTLELKKSYKPKRKGCPWLTLLCAIFKAIIGTDISKP